jgi:hypothetical protein
LSAVQQFSHSKETDRMPADSRKVKDKSERQRFIEAAREAGASEDEAVFRENLKQLASAKPDKSEVKKGRHD